MEEKSATAVTQCQNRVSDGSFARNKCGIWIRRLGWNLKPHFGSSVVFLWKELEISFTHAEHKISENLWYYLVCTFVVQIIVKPRPWPWPILMRKILPVSLYYFESNLLQTHTQLMDPLSGSVWLMGLYTASCSPYQGIRSVATHNDMQTSSVVYSRELHVPFSSDIKMSVQLCVIR